jgi:hypothetical protein
LDSAQGIVKSKDGRVFTQVDRRIPGRWTIRSHPLSTKISGWLKVNESPEAVVVFVGGSYVGSAEISSPVEGRKRTGFSLRVSDSLVEEQKEIEIFAILGEAAIRVAAQR